MAIWTVMTPPLQSGRDIDAVERAILLKDGFNIYAFLFTGLWLLAKKLWLAFAIFLPLWIALVVGGRLVGLHPLAIMGAQALAGVFLALEGGRLLERKLTRKGWTVAGVIEGAKRDAVERRFFEHAAMPPPARASAPTPMAFANVPSGAQSASVVGLFPDPQGR